MLYKVSDWNHCLFHVGNSANEIAFLGSQDTVLEKYKNSNINCPEMIFKFHSQQRQ